jgi:hypothetical protein
MRKMMIRYDHVRLRYTLVLAVGLVLTGCSGGGDDLPREPVSGTVTLGGQPLADGVIQFNPVGGATSVGNPVSGGAQIKGGQFSIPRDTGLVPGNYNVAIYSAEKRDRTKPAQVGGGKVTELAKELIPAKYNSQTELKAEIKKGVPSNFTFSLESK